MGNTNKIPVIPDNTCAKIKFKNAASGSPILTILINDNTVVDRLDSGKVTNYRNIPIHTDKTNIKIKWGHILQMERQIELKNGKIYELMLEKNYFPGTPYWILLFTGNEDIFTNFSRIG